MSVRTATKAPLLQALQGIRPERRPVWLMRQAGRYLPEYRAVRRRHSFQQMLADPQLAAEITMQPLRRYAELDAAILFTDLLVPLAAMGVEISFHPAPELAWTVRSRRDLERLHEVDLEAELRTPLATARLVAELLPPEQALIGFVGAPFTLAAYLVEGRGTKDWARVRAMAWSEVELFGDLLDRLADAAIAFGRAQVASGCAAIQVFDSWAGILAPDLFARLVLPRIQRVIHEIQGTGAPVVYFLNGAAPHLDAMARTGADALAVDWRTDLAELSRRMPPPMAIQGNLDPAVLFAPRDRIRAQVRSILSAVGRRPHVFNLGHGLDPATPVDGVSAALDAIREIDLEKAR